MPQTAEGALDGAAGAPLAGGAAALAGAITGAVYHVAIPGAGAGGSGNANDDVLTLTTLQTSFLQNLSRNPIRRSNAKGFLYICRLGGYRFRHFESQVE